MLAYLYVLLHGVTLERIKELFFSLVLLCLNHVVTHIPCWYRRKPFYLLAGMRIGKGSRILMNTIVQGPRSIVIGSHSYINGHCLLDGRGGLTIGDNVNVSNFSKLISGSHDMKSPTFDFRGGEVLIEDYCWIGTGAMVLDNSRLRRCSVLGAGSVFKGVSEQSTVYVGVPARAVKKRCFEPHGDLIWRPFFV